MPRRNPSLPDKTPQFKELTAAERCRFERELEIRVITPLYGGGVEAKKHDEILIRGSSIRGQLRFWWRATRGAHCASPKALYERESEIFGCTSTSSPLSLSVEVKDDGELLKKPELTANQRQARGRGGQRPPPNPLNYVLFPLENDDELVHQVDFTLKLTGPKSIEEDIKPALWAWTSLGGLGARTRRGLGALSVLKDSNGALTTPSKDDLAEWLRERLQVCSEAVRPWPTLSPKNLLMTGQCHRDAIVTWKNLVGALARFRQTGGRGSQSPWPETDSLKRKSYNKTWDHPPRQDMPTFFPRASFGMPLEFRFKDNRDQRAGTILRPQGHNRLASPVILRPFQVKEGFTSLVAFLSQQQNVPVQFQFGRNQVTLTSQEVDSQERAQSIPKMTIKGVTASNAVDAFRLLLLDGQYKEVPIQ